MVGSELENGKMDKFIVASGDDDDDDEACDLVKFLSAEMANTFDRTGKATFFV